jgi:hypothetical protein
MAAGRRDIADDRHRRSQDVGDHLAHRSDQPARRVELKDEDFGVPPGGNIKRFLELPGTCRPDGAVDGDAQRDLLALG